MDNTENLTARERMQLDMVYDDFDADLLNRRVTAKTLFKAFIQTNDGLVEKRNKTQKTTDKQTLCKRLRTI
ncbi:MAG: hypothetical protein K6A82_09260 [Prevotella sp.]|nr:hypothetical protein [Prevotella sp.]